MDTPSPRLAPLSDDEMSEDQLSLVAASGGQGRELQPASNIFRTMVRNAGLFRRWLPFSGKLLFGGKLSPRDREILILRTAWNTQSDYEWGQHARLGRQAGLTDDEVAGLTTSGPTADDWSDDDALLIRVADELHADSCISDVSWARLAERYNEQQLIEIPMLVGHYHMVAFSLRSLGVEREDGVEGFPASR
jgi:alkylhydroperoxidase family enzyme